jgi:exonuclease III
MPWNVRGLNNQARQEDVNQVVSMFKPDVICIQETKLSCIDQCILRSTLGVDYEGNFCYLPTNGTRGGILLVARDHLYQIQQPVLTDNTITATLVDQRTNISWTMTGVYGPQGELEKMFLRELKRIKRLVSSRWLLLGDFNLIYREQDKSSGGLNRGLMLCFRRTLNRLAVKEIELTGRKYTWSNNQASPTLTRIDRAFCTPEWEEIFATPILQPLSSSISDHCPFMVIPLIVPRTKPRFRFESHWSKMHGFLNCVQEAWNKEVPMSQNPLGTLCIKLSRTAKVLWAWSRATIPTGKLAMSICREVIK